MCLVEIPAQYDTVQRRKMTAEGHVEWRPVLCETNVTTDMVRRIQNALDQAGGGEPVLIEGVQVTPSGVRRLAQLSQQGYTVISP